MLEQSPCQHIIRSFLGKLDITFMQYLKNGTLNKRLAIEGTPIPILEWMQQPSCAVAYLESHGYAHSDINPRNILVDENDQLKLADFDHTLRIADNLDVGYEPYVRAPKSGLAGGCYGVAGLITELNGHYEGSYFQDTDSSTIRRTRAIFNR